MDTNNLRLDDFIQLTNAIPKEVVLEYNLVKVSDYARFIEQHQDCFPKSLLQRTMKPYPFIVVECATKDIDYKVNARVLNKINNKILFCCHERHSTELLFVPKKECNVVFRGADIPARISVDGKITRGEQLTTETFSPKHNLCLVLLSNYSLTEMRHEELFGSLQYRFKIEDADDDICIDLKIGRLSDAGDDTDILMLRY